MSTSSPDPRNPRVPVALALGGHIGLVCGGTAFDLFWETAAVAYTFLWALILIPLAWGLNVFQFAVGLAAAILVSVRLRGAQAADRRQASNLALGSWLSLP